MTVLEKDSSETTQMGIRKNNKRSHPPQETALHQRKRSKMTNIITEE